MLLNSILAISVAVFIALLVATIAPSGEPFLVSRDGIASKDTLLKQFPFMGTRDVKNSFDKDRMFTVKTPYHSFDSIANIIQGRAVNYDAVQSFVTNGSNPNRAPLKVTKTKDGNALASVWLMDYKNTGIGPYKEIILSTWVGIESVSCESTDPYCFLSVWNKQSSGAQLFIMRLWLDSEVAVAYGRDLFGTDKYLEKDIRIKHNSVNNLESFFAPAVLKASISSAATMGNFVLASIKYNGIGGFLKTFFTPFFDTSCVTPKGIATVIPKDVNPVMISRLANNLETTVHEWNPEQGDRLDFLHTTTSPSPQLGKIFLDIGFEPKVTLRDPNCRFAFLQPVN